MLDEAFIRALLAGLMLAAVAGPLGCLVVWRRLAYFSDAMAHAALLGVAISILFSVNLLLAVFSVAVLVALAILAAQGRAQLPTDAFLGLLAHGSLATGLVALSFTGKDDMHLEELLFGDIVSVTRNDLLLLLAGAVAVIIVLAKFWRRFFAVAVSREVAAAEGINPDKMDLLFMVMLAGVVAVAVKLVGALLVTALLIMPAAAARRLSLSPVAMAFAAAAAGGIAVVAGFFASHAWQTPSGPSIVVAALLLFIISLLLPSRKVEISNVP
jgi:zinc transport system permease protein